MVKYGYLKELIFSALMISYLYTVLLINQNYDLLVGYIFITIALEIFPIGFVIVFLFNKHFEADKFKDLLIHVGLLQGLFSMLAFIIPAFQNWVINTMLAYGYNDVILKMSGHRMYGLSYTLPYSMPIVQSVIASLSVYLGINKSKKYFLFTPILIFSGVINARIFIVLFIIGVLLIIFSSIQMNFKKLFNLIFIIFITILVANPVISFVEEKHPKTFLWIQDGIEELLNIIDGDTSGYYMSYVTDKSNYILPEGIQLLFGTTERVIRSNVKFQSDIGYINDIWFGGLIYSILIYGYLIIKVLKIRTSLIKFQLNGNIISLFLILTIAASNIKGTIFAVNEFVNLFIIIYIYCISINDKKILSETN